MRRLKLIGWFIWDHPATIAAFLIAAAIFVFVISPAVDALVTAITAALN